MKTTTTQTTIMLIAVIVAVSTTTSFAYADGLDNGVAPGIPVIDNNGIMRYDLTIQVPFDVTGHSCEVTGPGQVMVCIIQGMDSPQIDLEEAMFIPPENVEVTIQCAEGEELDSETGICLPWLPPEFNGAVTQEPEEKKTEKQTNIERLKELQASGFILPSEFEVLRLLEKAEVACELGVNEWQDIQTYAYFDIPKDQVDITRSFKYDRNHLLSSLAKLIETCEHVVPYGKEHLGAEYTNRIVADKDAVENELKRISDLSALSFNYGAALSEHDLIEAAQDANDTICNSTLYGEHTKANYGCLNIEEAPNRGGYTDVSKNSIYMQYLESKETGINVVNPDKTPDDYLSAYDKAKSYVTTYRDLPFEIIKELTAEEIERLIEYINSLEEIPAIEGETN